MAWRVFYSYAHEDALWREKLAVFLKPLVQKGSMAEWHDREIKPGSDWNAEISERLRSADLIFLLVSEHFLASDYCFGVEVETAMERLKQGGAQVVPILLKPCLWKESRFSALQVLPRSADPISTRQDPDAALAEVAAEVAKLVRDPPPAPPVMVESKDQATVSLAPVREQVRAYAHRYERIRQRMRASSERTRRMKEVFVKMRELAPASYPMLEELAASPSPGERLAAVAILQVFASQQHLEFLVGLVGSEKPFVGYQAVEALRVAANALHPRALPALLSAMHEARVALDTAPSPSDTGRLTLLAEAERELREAISLLSEET